MLASLTSRRTRANHSRKITSFCCFRCYSADSFMLPVGSEVWSIAAIRLSVCYIRQMAARYARVEMPLGTYRFTTRYLIVREKFFAKCSNRVTVRIIRWTFRHHRDSMLSVWPKMPTLLFMEYNCVLHWLAIQSHFLRCPPSCNGVNSRRPSVQQKRRLSNLLSPILQLFCKKEKRGGSTRS